MATRRRWAASTSNQHVHRRQRWCRSTRRRMRRGDFFGLDRGRGPAAPSRIALQLPIGIPARGTRLHMRELELIRLLLLLLLLSTSSGAVLWRSPRRVDGTPHEAAGGSLFKSVCVSWRNFRMVGDGGLREGGEDSSEGEWRDLGGEKLRTECIASPRASIRIELYRTGSAVP